MLCGLPDDAGSGGDFHDVFALNGGFRLSIGAVGGRGQTTAALAKVAKFTLQAEALRDLALFEPNQARNTSVDLTMRATSAFLSQNFRRRLELSLLHALYEPQLHRLTFCNCSRWPPALLRNGEVAFFDERHPQVGDQWYRQYPPVEIVLSPGDIFVAYTDGLPEARRRNAMLGVGPIRRALQEHPDDSPGQLVEHLLELAESFCADTHPENDALVLVARAADPEVGHAVG